MNNLREELSHHSWHAISPQETSQSSQIVEAKVKVSSCPKTSSHTPSHILKGILIAFVLPACVQWPCQMLLDLKLLLGMAYWLLVLYQPWFGASVFL